MAADGGHEIGAVLGATDGGKANPCVHAYQPNSCESRLRAVRVIPAAPQLPRVVLLRIASKDTKPSIPPINWMRGPVSDEVSAKFTSPLLLGAETGNRARLELLLAKSRTLRVGHTTNEFDERFGNVVRDASRFVAGSGLKLVQNRLNQPGGLFAYHRQDSFS